MAAVAQFPVDEAAVELGVVRDEPRIADECHELGGNRGESGLVGKEPVGKPVHRLGLGGPRPARIYVRVERPPRFDAADEFDAANLADAMPVRRVETGRLGVEDDLTHDLQYRTP